VLCPRGAATGYVDAYELVPGPGNVVDVTVSAGATPCSEMELLVEVFGEDGDLRDWARGEGACPSFTSGGYASDGLLRTFLTSESPVPLDYTLVIEARACDVDADGDGYLAQSCGGPDCNDADNTAYPGAPEVAGDGFDSDCDGGDRLPSCDDVPTITPTAEADQLLCGDADSGKVWDAWTVSAPAGACVAVAVDNLGGEADPRAVIVGPSDDSIALDDEADCTADPWTRALIFPFDQGCPLGGGTASIGGVHTVWVSQVDDPGGSNCPDDAPYGLTVWVDGEIQTPTLVGDDVVFSP